MSATPRRTTGSTARRAPASRSSPSISPVSCGPPGPPPQNTVSPLCMAAKQYLYLGANFVGIAAKAEHFREISWKMPVRREAGAPQPREILAQIARVVGFVKGDRENVEHRIVIGLVAALQRIDENQRSAGPQHPPDLRDRGAADAWWELVEQIDADDDIEFRVG